MHFDGLKAPINPTDPEAAKIIPAQIEIPHHSQNVPAFPKIH